MCKSVSIAKPNDHTPNEDAVFCSPRCIAVSDGAGGCGLYADEWSRYLMEHLPRMLRFVRSQNLMNGWTAFGRRSTMSMKNGLRKAMASCLTSSTTKARAPQLLQLGKLMMKNVDG